MNELLRSRLLTVPLTLITLLINTTSTVAKGTTVRNSTATTVSPSHAVKSGNENYKALSSPVTSASRLADVQLTDWAFGALQSLAEHYGCVIGDMEDFHEGQQSLSRYQFAVELSRCLAHIDQSIGAATAELLTKEESIILQRLKAEFATELATLSDRINSLETNISELSENQFAPTTQLSGEVNTIVSDIVGGVAQTNNLVAQTRVRLTFDTSFTGEDRLRVRFLFGNFEQFNTTDDSGNSVLGDEGRLGISTNTDNDIRLGSLSYRFPMGDQVINRVYLQGGSMISLVDPVNPFNSSGQGAISRFGRYNPIYRVAGGTGIGTTIELSDVIALQLGYLASEADDSSSGAGLFNGNYSIVGQLTLTPSNRIKLGLTYLNAYAGGNRGNFTGTGSDRASVQIDRPVSINSYGIEANIEVTDGFEIGGWAGFSAVRAIELGDADVWNYALTLAFPDLGAEGNLGGIVVGVQPRLTGSTPRLGEVIGRRSDPDVGLHIEGFYRYRLNDHISITPGIVWLTAPNHDDENRDIIIGALRATFTF